MRTYCQSGTFQRGQEAVSGDASIAMFGNTTQPVDVMVQAGHLFAPMPDIIRDDTAFIDRMHFYIPGWEIPQIRNDLFTNHYGFIVDYLTEVLSPALLILGDLSVQGNIKPLRSLTEPLQVANDNSAKRALIPIENKRNFLDVSADIIDGRARTHLKSSSGHRGDGGR